MRYLFGDYALDTSRWELRRTRKLIKLRPKVFDVLIYLITHRDRVISRQEILDRLWTQQFVGEATLSSCIMEARQAVGDTEQAQRFIQTLHGRGYRFVAAVEEASDSPPEGATASFLAPPGRSAQAVAASLTAAHAASAPEDQGHAAEYSLVLGRETDARAEAGGLSSAALEGEPKPVTILCCALTDAKGLSAHVGLEAMYRLMWAFFALTQRVVQHYAGTLTQRLGDGFVAYFGAPVAHEDHARRAVLAALELRQRACEEPALRDTPVEYLVGHCLAYDQATPYGPVLGILRQLCGMTNADGPETMATKLQQCLREAGRMPDEDAPYLLTLLGVPEGSAALAGISPEVRKARTLAILRHVSLHSRQGRPLVIVVENVHWIDPSSEEYLACLADSLLGAHLLLVTTYRPGYCPPWLDKSYATQPALPRLLTQDSRAVVKSVLSSIPDGDSWEQTILETAAGNPFFREELAWAVREGGVEQPTAVIGHEVPLRPLQAIAELPEDVLQRGLARLQAREFLYEARPFPDLAYTFKHALTYQVAYSTLLQERQCALHARIVDAIEEIYADRLAEQVERLAQHAWQGEVWEKAVVYLRQTGAKAIAGSANREAVAHFERALVGLQYLPESRTTLEQAIDVRCELRSALLPLNERGRMFDILREAEALAQALDDQRRLGKVAILITHYLWSMWDLDDALTTGHQALDLATTRKDLSLQAMAYMVIPIPWSSPIQGLVVCTSAKGRSTSLSPSLTGVWKSAGPGIFN